MTSQDLCHTSRHFVTRHVMNSSHNRLSDFTGAAGWQRFSYFQFIESVVSWACGVRPGSMKPICYTWVFISHHTDRSLSIVDGLLACHGDSKILSHERYITELLIISKKLDHGARGKPQSLASMLTTSIIDSRNFRRIITRLKIESPSTVGRFSQMLNFSAVLSTLVFSHQPDAKYPPQ